MAALRYFFYLLMKPFTLGMAFLGWMGIFAPNTDPNQWWIPAFSGLLLPVILIINLVTLLFWIYCKKWWVILPLIPLVLNYNFYSLMFQNPYKQNPLPSDKTITIASYNVEGFYWINKTNTQDQIRKLIETYHIDILCIQEHCESPDISPDSVRKFTGLPYRRVFFNHETHWANYGMSVYSRYPIIDYGIIDFNSIKNEAMWVDLVIQNDTVRVFNNHLQTTDISLNAKEYYKQKSIKDWKGQARTLVRIFENLKDNFRKRADQSIIIRQIIDTSRYPVIVCGDFNDTPVSFAYNHIRQSDLKDGFQECGKGYGHSFNGLKRILRIDFIAYGKGFQGVGYESPELPYSDHNPIIMQLNLK